MTGMDIVCQLFEISSSFMNYSLLSVKRERIIVIAWILSKTYSIKCSDFWLYRYNPIRF